MQKNKAENEDTVKGETHREVIKSTEHKKLLFLSSLFYNIAAYSMISIGKALSSNHETAVHEVHFSCVLHPFHFALEN